MACEQICPTIMSMKSHIAKASSSREKQTSRSTSKLAARSSRQATVVSLLNLCVSSLHRGYGDYICSNHGGCRARGVVVSHPLSMREALGSIPSVSRCHYHSNVDRWSPTGSHHVMRWMCMCQALLREVLASSTCARPLAGQTPKRKTATEAGKRCFSPLPGPAYPPHQI